MSDASVNVGPGAAGVPRRRRWWLALLLSGLLPGLGQIYSGASRRGVLMIAAVLAISLAYRLSAAESFVALLATAAVGVLLWLFAMYDAARQCNPAAGHAAARQRPWYAYLATLVAAGIAVTLIEIGVQATVGNPKSYYNPSGSMEPALQVGDYFIGWVREEPRLWLRRGDLIIFRTRLGSDYVKRVMGMPGDSVSFSGGLPLIAGMAVTYTPLPPGDAAIRACPAESIGVRTRLPEGRSWFMCAEPVRESEGRTYVVPQDSVFVLGDNLGRSLDSRMAEIGMVPFASIVARAQYIFWSREFARVGQRLD